MLKKLTSLMLGGVLCVALIGCGGSEPTAPDVVTPPPEDPPAVETEAAAPPPPAVMTLGW